MKYLRTFLSSLALLLLAGAALALPGSIKGKIFDQANHEPVMGVTVTVLNTPFGAISDSGGIFTVSNLPPGYYNLRFSRMGYKVILKNRVLVRSAMPTLMEVDMGVKPLSLSGMVVKSTYFEKTKDAVSSSHRMDFEEITAQPGGYFDVQRAVQALPSVASVADQNNEIIVRGGNAGENLFLVDNIEVPNPNHFSKQGASGGAVGIINTDFIRQMDFFTGAFPAKYGNKVSSVMDIKLRDGTGERQRVKAEGGFSGLGLTWEGPFVPASTFLLSYHKSYPSFIRSRFGITGIPHYSNLQGKFAYDINPRQKVTVLALYGNDDYRLDIENALKDDFQHSVNYSSWQYTVGASFHTVYPQGYTIHTLSRNFNHWTQTEADTNGTETYRAYANEGETSFKMDMGFYLSSDKKNELGLGFAVRNTQVSNDIWLKADTMLIYDPYTGVVTDTTSYIYDLRVHKYPWPWRYAGYLQHSWTPVSFFTLRSGVRFDYVDYTSQMDISPRIGTSFQIFENTALNFSYGRCYQPPDWYQLGIDTANRRLQSKYNDQFVAGLEHIFAEDIKGTLEAYYKTFRDVPIQKVLTTSDPSDRSNIYINQGRGYSQGVELFLQKKVKENFWGTLSYSYSTSQMEDPRYPGTYYDWDYDYRNIATAIAGYRNNFNDQLWYVDMRYKWWFLPLSVIPLFPGDETEYSIRWRFLGGRPYTPMIMHPELRLWQIDEQVRLNTERADPYNRVDFHAQRRWFWDRVGLVSYFEIDNLTNYPNIWEYQYTWDGKRKPIYQYGLNLTAGIIIEF
jgi:outer membrane receptor for ferrienterochelin and colicin